MNDKIPDAVMKAAQLVYDRLGLGSATDERAIARAILAERERCAKIAADFGWVLPMFENAEINEATDAAACAVQEQIAAAIRGEHP